MTDVTELEFLSVGIRKLTVQSYNWGGEYEYWQEKLFNNLNNICMNYQLSVEFGRLKSKKYCCRQKYKLQSYEGELTSFWCFRICKLFFFSNF